MSSLSDFTPPKSVIPSRGGNIEVRAIAFDDVAVLMKDHLSDIDALVEIFGRTGVTSTDQLASELVTHSVALIREAPGLVARLIAIACDDPDSVEKARSMSMALQVKIIKEVAMLTFEEAGGPKNFVESLMILFRAMRSPSPTETVSLT